jgi:hypothetical protein
MVTIERMVFKIVVAKSGLRRVEDNSPYLGYGGASSFVSSGADHRL